MGVRPSLDGFVFANGICKLPGVVVLVCLEMDGIRFFLGSVGVQLDMEPYFLRVPET